MSARTAIAWTDHTHNPWIGCTRISPGCDNCYAAAEWGEGGRFSRVVWGGERSRTKKQNDPVKWDRDAAAAGVRRRVFCASLADVFDNQVPEDWRADLWALIARCRNLDWLLLTKRPQNIGKMLPPDWGDGWPHVWLGCTAENQEEADRRLPILLRVPAVVHFASVEPQLEAVDLRQYLAAGLDWVIVGGESGSGCRPFNPDWARVLRDQCRTADTAFFMKQLGGNRDKRDRITDLPLDLRVREWPR